MYLPIVFWAVSITLGFTETEGETFHVLCLLNLHSCASLATLNLSIVMYPDLHSFKLFGLFFDFASMRVMSSG